MDVPEINSISPGTPQEGNFRSEADKNSFRERGVRREICGTKKTAYRPAPPEGNFRSEAEKNSFREGGGEGDMRN
jgi:hypothetical protein